MRIVIENLTRSIEGWLTIDEGCLLYNLAKITPKELAIVEIGSWKGLSTVCMGLGSRDGCNAQIYAVDPHHGANQESLFHQNPENLKCTLDDFMANIRSNEISHLITPVVNYSEYASVYIVKKPVGLIFIDGVHDYLSVKKDFLLWYPRVSIGGYMAFHDSANTTFLGSQQAVKESLFESGLFADVIIVGCITYGKKIK